MQGYRLKGAGRDIYYVKAALSEATQYRDAAQKKCDHSSIQPGTAARSIGFAM